MWSDNWFNAFFVITKTVISRKPLFWGHNSIYSCPKAFVIASLLVSTHAVLDLFLSRSTFMKLFNIIGSRLCTIWSHWAAFDAKAVMLLITDFPSLSWSVKPTKGKASIMSASLWRCSLVLSFTLVIYTSQFMSWPKCYLPIKLWSIFAASIMVCVSICRSQLSHWPKVSNK